VILDESDRVSDRFVHTTRSVLGLGLILSFEFMSWVIFPCDLDGLVDPTCPLLHCE